MMQHAPLAVVLLAALVAMAAYVQALNYPFVSDDLYYLPENAKLLGLHFAELYRLFIEPYNQIEFLPLRDLSYWFDIALFGLNPAAFRAHNIMLYALCLPLVYGVTLGLWRYFRPADEASAPWAAATVTALFALHPAHVESVVWISSRKDVLSVMFSLLALWFALHARRGPGFSARFATAALVALLAAMLSKATALVVAPVIAMLWLMFWLDAAKQSRRYATLLWPAASLLLVMCAALIFTANSSVKGPAYFGIETVTRLLAVLGELVRLVITPESRHFLYPVFEDPLFYVMVAAGVAVLIAAAVGAVLLLRRRSLAGFALVVFVLLCMPYTQLIPYVTFSLVSDRFLTLAVWPAMLLLVLLAWRMKPVPRAALLIIFALALGFQTIERPRDWSSYEALIDHDAAGYPGYYPLAYQKITRYQLPQGLYREATERADKVTVAVARDALVKLVESYRAMHEAAQNGDPRDALLRLRNLESLLKQAPAQAAWNPPMLHFWNNSLGSFALEWQYLVKSFPNDMTVRYNAGLSLFNINRYAEAVEQLGAVMASQQLPEHLRGTTLVLLGAALLNTGRSVEAEMRLNSALQQSPPDFRAYCVFSELYKKAGRLNEAASAEAECRNHMQGAAQ